MTRRPSRSPRAKNVTRPRPTGQQSGILPSERDMLERVRAHLFSTGACTMEDIAHACGVTVGAIGRLLRAGAVRTAPTLSEPLRCDVCGSPVHGISLCADCRDRFTEPLIRRFELQRAAAAAETARLAEEERPASEPPSGRPLRPRPPDRRPAEAPPEGVRRGLWARHSGRRRD